MSDVPMTHDTQTTGSRLPAEIPWSGAQSGLGLKPDLEGIAGMSEIGGIFNRPAHAAANDAVFDEGLIAEGRDDGVVDSERSIPWL